MLYPKNIEQKLGFDQIRQWLLDTCISTMGEDFVRKLKFSDDFDTIQKRLNQVDELTRIFQLEPNFPTQNYLDMRQSLDLAAIPGTYLDEEHFFGLKLSVQTIHQLFQIFFTK